MRTKLFSVLATVAIALLVLSGVALAGGLDSMDPPAGKNSVRITVGGETMTNVAEGTVVYEGEKRAGDAESENGEAICEDPPSVRIQMKGDVQKVRVGMEEGSCNLVVKSLEMNYSMPEEPTPTQTGFNNWGFNTQAGWEWYVESLRRWSASSL